MRRRVTHGLAGVPPALRHPGIELFGSAGIEALRDLGLALTVTCAPVDMLVIESVEKARDTEDRLAALTSCFRHDQNAREIGGE